MTDGNDFLMGGGIPSAKFAIKGATVRGTVLALPVTRQQTDMVTKEGKFYKNGDPMMQVVIRLQTDERDSAIDNDDGVRATYVKGASVKKLREAIRRAGAKGLEVGGYLTQKYVADELPTGGLPQGAKVYEFTYSRPSADYMHEDSATPVVQSYNPPTAQPAPTTPTQPAAQPSPLDALNDEQRAALAALGFKG